MSFLVVAFHHPLPEHHDEMVQRIGRAAEVMRTVPGCLDAGCWTEESGAAVVGTGRFLSRDAWLAAIHAVAHADVDFDFDARECRSRDVHTLIEAS